MYSGPMLSAQEQEDIRPRLEKLSNRQLLSLWDRLGIKIAQGQTRDEYLDLDKVWLIGPLLADSEYSELLLAVDEVFRTSQKHSSRH